MQINSASSSLIQIHSKKSVSLTFTLSYPGSLASLRFTHPPTDSMRFTRIGSDSVRLKSYSGAWDLCHRIQSCSDKSDSHRSIQIHKTWFSPIHIHSIPLKFTQNLAVILESNQIESVLLHCILPPVESSRFTMIWPDLLARGQTDEA